MEQAIRKAIEGGWDDTDYAFKMSVSKEPVSTDKVWDVGLWQYDSKCLLDPEFWQSLGKAENWWNRVGKYGINLDMMAATEDNSIPGWLHYWHTFIDHLAEGKDPDLFFTSLLTEQGL